jgi:type II secretory pathway component PulJ
MNCDSKNMLSGWMRPAFTFMEVVTALVIVSVITFGVLVVINRSVAAMLEGQAKMRAFELARENMEKLVSADSITDKAEFGTDEFDGDIQWETNVEPFNEPVKSDMWIRAVCSASYLDRNGERQKIELVHWLTDVTATQKKQIVDQQKREQEFLENMEGNPYGDNPDGLIKYANALMNMGEYETAARALLQITTEHPDSPQATMVAAKTVEYAWNAFYDGYPDVAQGIFDRVKTGYPQDPDIQKLPDVANLEPGETPNILIIPAAYRPKQPSQENPWDSSERSPDTPKDTKPDSSDTSKDTDTSDNPEDNAEPTQKPGNYRGFDLPSDFDTWTAEQQNMWKKLVDLLAGR